MQSEELYYKMSVNKYTHGSGFEKIHDPVIRESSIRIWLNGQELVAILALKQELKELAVGFLYGECILSAPEKIRAIEINDRLDTVMVETDETIPIDFKAIIRSVTSGCGKGATFINPLKEDQFGLVVTKLTLRAEDIIRLMSDFRKKSELFNLTGGVHTCAWSDGQSIIRTSDDIGRHNCIDKLIGWKLLNPAEAGKCHVILSTGRLSSDITSKALRARIPFIISNSAPTSGAIQLADAYGITMVGFARGQRLNVYTHKGRIIE